MTHKRILITSPSLNVKDNVSGISSLIVNIIHTSRFDFLHFQLGRKDGLQRGFKWALQLINTYVQLIQTSLVKQFDIVHLNLGLEKPSIIRDSFVFFLLKRIFHKKVILHVHGGYYLMNAPRQKYLIFLLQQLFKYADCIIVLSTLEKEILEKRYGTMKFIVLPNAVNIGLPLEPKKPLQKMVLRFIFMGRINKTKGIYTISESFKYLSNYFDRFVFDIYGAGPDLDDWLSELKSYPGLQFAYHGIANDTEKWQILHASDVFLLPSLHSEGLPVAMIEAMAVGCAVIVTDVASVRTVVNSSNGILLSESCPVLLANKIKEIIENKIDIHAVGQHAKEFVQSNLLFSSYIRNLDSLYATL